MDATERMAQKLIKRGIIDERTLYDPEGYDGGKMLGKVALLAEDLRRENATLRAQRDALLEACKSLLLEFESIIPLIEAGQGDSGPDPEGVVLARSAIALFEKGGRE